MGTQPGMEVDPKRKGHEYGSLGWFVDSEVNQVESRQPM